MHVIFLFTCLTCNYMHYMHLHIFYCFSYPFVGPSCPVTSLLHAANIPNTHEELHFRLSTFLHILIQKSPIIQRLGNSASIVLFDHGDQITPCSIPALTTCGTADACCSSLLLSEPMSWGQSAYSAPFCPSWSSTVLLIQKRMTE